ncbi:MAG TPA: class I fructose-bisphosphate aldolase [Candidatus Saccharimonadales bacterium]|nr:class I fructose-bisphosphate aldolase [Candidatus Saccharimonadales bacterium]
MDTQKLEEIVRKLVTVGKGILAADESANTCQKRFDAVGIECTEESRRQYRGLLFTTPGAEHSLNGVILYDETFWQKTDAGQTFRAYLSAHDVVPGIKVDLGLVDLPGFPNEKLTQGLDGLPERMAKYAEAGALFAKWRCVITIGEGIPTDECIGANALVLARYARICQEAGIVPFVEPEVLFDGNHTSEQCETVMAHTFDVLFQTLRAFRVHLPGIILKTSMVLPGKDSGMSIDHNEVADRTCRVLHEHVPHEVGGIVFLSGGQTSNDALINLNRIVQRGPHPWNVTFSFSRALQDAVLKAWAEKHEDIAAVQDVFHQKLVLASAASKGGLDEEKLEHDDFVSHSQDL